MGHECGAFRRQVCVYVHAIFLLDPWRGERPAVVERLAGERSPQITRKSPESSTGLPVKVAMSTSWPAPLALSS